MSKGYLKDLVVNHNLCKSKSASLIGTKAKNLLSLPRGWVPPFFVITTKAYRYWLLDEAKDSLSPDLVGMIGQCKSALAESHKNAPQISGLIIRQSVDQEMLDDRGLYYSKRCKFNDRDVNHAIIESWDKFSEMSKGSRQVAIIVQSYVIPHAKGHLSNERRFSKSKGDWVYQYELPLSLGSDVLPVQATARSLTSAPNLSGKNISALEIRLKEVASLLLKRFPSRSHLEWVWDGKKLWIVQIDFETKRRNLENSLSIAGSLQNKEATPSLVSLKYFKKAEESSKSWHKVTCVQVFKTLNLPYPYVYVLDDEDIIKNLCEVGDVGESLRRDLSRLCKCPIIIRTDIFTEEPFNSFLLPRTDVVWNVEEASKFLTDTAKYFKKAGISPSKFCFIAHHYVHAEASAWSSIDAYSKAVNIDSIWGSPDGLLYYPHDSFHVTEIPGSAVPSIQKEVRFKPYSIKLDVSGNWIRRECGPAKDWKATLTKKEILTIYNYSQRISDYIGASLQIMFLVGVDRVHSKSGVLPWFYTSKIVKDMEDSQKAHNYSPQLFEHLKVKNRQDINLLRFRSSLSGKRLLIHLIPDEEMLRAKDLVVELGSLSRQYGYIIKLEGSRLSHIYYMLKREGIDVL
ncbi:MAG TPA: hypothetical protein VF658_21325 [Pyrinomonadaceae bacterium]|jgi:hypothetical protein